MDANLIDKFFLDYVKIAEKEQERTGIHKVAILAQAALESNYGKNAYGNNFFGVKADKNWKGDKQLLRTTEYHSSPSKVYPVILSMKKVVINGKEQYEYKIRDWFRKYATAEEGFQDHSNFFFENKRYAKALEFKSDPQKFIEAVVAAGYATDPKYINSITLIINYYIKL